MARPDSTACTSDPGTAAQVVAAFEMVWERAVPHAEYTV
ncbi:DUF6879 family protein [Sphaerisporangium perillae]